MNFVHGFCNGNCRAAVMGYRQRNSLLRIPLRGTFDNEHRNLRQIGQFRRTKQNLTNDLEKVMFWQHFNKDQVQEELHAIFQCRLVQQGYRYAKFCSLCVSMLVKQYSLFPRVHAKCLRSCEWLQPLLNFWLISCQGCGSLYLGWYYQQKKFALLNTGKSIRGSTKPF